MFFLYNDSILKKSFDLVNTFGMKYSGGGDYHGGNKPDIASETKKQSDNSIRVGSETQENSAVVFLLHHYSLFEACIFIQN